MKLSFLIPALALALAASAPALAAPGEQHPADSTCTCQKCGDKGGDKTGKCNSVCKGKEVYAAGSEPHDYCKASAKAAAAATHGAMQNKAKAMAAPK